MPSFETEPPEAVSVGVINIGIISAVLSDRFARLSLKCLVLPELTPIGIGRCILRGLATEQIIGIACRNCPSVDRLDRPTWFARGTGLVVLFSFRVSADAVLACATREDAFFVERNPSSVASSHQPQSRLEPLQKG